MGSSFKKAIFDEHVQEGLVGWAQKIKKRKAKGGSSKPESTEGSAAGIQLTIRNLQEQPLMEETKINNAVWLMSEL